MKKVIDVEGNAVFVDDTRKKLRQYSNREQKILYNAEIFEDGAGTGFYTEYFESGTIDGDMKYDLWNTVAKFKYAKSVKYNADENDPDRKIWNEVVAHLKKNESKYFDKYGDWKEAEIWLPDMYWRNRNECYINE